MSMPKPSLLTRLTDPIRRRREYSRINQVQLSSLAAMSLTGSRDIDGDALIVAYPAIARSVYLDVAAARRRLTAHMAGVEAALAQLTHHTAYRDAR